jgi:superfamily II DNA or RNA helicase
MGEGACLRAKVTDLIKDGFLVPMKCYAPDRTLHRGRPRTRGVAGDLVQSWQQYAENVPTILFTARVMHSRAAVDAFRSVGISAEHIDADTPDVVRDRILEGLADGRVKVVSNVGIFKEGTDVPILGCCQLFMKPPERVSFLQAVGRIMRPFPGKTHGILIDHGGAIFRWGFPDEDTEWTLDGNVNENFAKSRLKGRTESALYCKHCQRVYHGTLQCRADVSLRSRRDPFSPRPSWKVLTNS